MRINIQSPWIPNWRVTVSINDDFPLAAALIRMVQILAENEKSQLQRLFERVLSQEYEQKENVRLSLLYKHYFRRSIENNFADYFRLVPLLEFTNMLHIHPLRSIDQVFSDMPPEVQIIVRVNEESLEQAEEFYFSYFASNLMSPGLVERFLNSFSVCEVKDLVHADLQNFPLEDLCQYFDPCDDIRDNVELTCIMTLFEFDSLEESTADMDMDMDQDLEPDTTESRRSRRRRRPIQHYEPTQQVNPFVRGNAESRLRQRQQKYDFQHRRSEDWNRLDRYNYAFAPVSFPARWDMGAAPPDVYSRNDLKKYEAQKCFNDFEEEEKSEPEIKSYLLQDPEHIVILGPGTSTSRLGYNSICTTRETLFNLLNNPLQIIFPCTGLEDQLVIDKNVPVVRLTIKEYDTFIPIRDIEHALTAETHLFRIKPTTFKYDRTTTLQYLTHFDGSQKCQAGTDRMISRLVPMQFI